jgi:hypothetical protein
MMAQCGVGEQETTAALGMEMAHTQQAQKQFRLDCLT